MIKIIISFLSACVICVLAFVFFTRSPSEELIEIENFLVKERIKGLDLEIIFSCLERAEKILNKDEYEVVCHLLEVKALEKRIKTLENKYLYEPKE